MLAVAWPPASAGASSAGALRGSPTPAACKLAALKQCPPFLRYRLHCSAMPQGQRSQEGEGGPTCIAQAGLADGMDLVLRLGYTQDRIC